MASGSWIQVSDTVRMKNYRTQNDLVLFNEYEPFTTQYEGSWHICCKKGDAMTNLSGHHLYFMTHRIKIPCPGQLSS